MSTGDVAIPIIPFAIIDYIIALHMPLVDAVVFLQPHLAVAAQEPTGPPFAPSPPSHQLATAGPLKRAPYGATRMVDKQFPVPLLKCPISIFIAFADAYHIQPIIVKALRAARRRKVNRKWKRVSRCKHTRMIPSRADLESDDEGECATIDGPEMFAKLMAMSEELA